MVGDFWKGIAFGPTIPWRKAFQRNTYAIVHISTEESAAVLCPLLGPSEQRRKQLKTCPVWAEILTLSGTESLVEYWLILKDCEPKRSISQKELWKESMGQLSGRDGEVQRVIISIWGGWGVGGAESGGRGSGVEKRTLQNPRKKQ